MKVLLVYPNIYGMNMLPSAIGVFSTLLKADGHEVELFDSTDWIIPGEDCNSDKEKSKLLTARPFDDSKLAEAIKDTDVFEEYRKAVLRFAPDLLAVSLAEDMFPVARKLLERTKDLHIPTIMGGAFPTFAPEKCLALDTVDMVCIGEGERALVDLCRRMDAGRPYEDVLNLHVKTPRGIVRNPMAPPIDLDESPLIDVSIFSDIRLYRPMQGRLRRMLPVETHRGCPYQCTYCSSPSQSKLYRDMTHAKYFRKKSFDMLHRDLAFFKNEVKAEALYFWADTFLSYTDSEFEEFCEMYQDIRLPFWCQSRIETIDEERIVRLMDLGMFRMGFGVEQGNEQFRKNVLRRNVSNQVIVDKLAILSNLDLLFSVNNIVGFPTETRALAMDTVELNRKIRSDSANASVFCPFHGTPLRKLSEDMGYIDKDLIARSVMSDTSLDMPQFRPSEIDGFRRCFTYYIRLPRSRWPDIEKAEKFTPEGDRIWQELHQECLEVMNLN